MKALMILALFVNISKRQQLTDEKPLVPLSSKGAIPNRTLKK